MSNPVYLNSMKFEGLGGHVSYGYTISDNEDQDFDSCAEHMIEDDLELLKYVRANGGSSARDILDFVAEEEKGIEINDTFYDWDEIKKAMKS